MLVFMRQKEKGRGRYKVGVMVVKDRSFTRTFVLLCCSGLCILYWYIYQVCFLFSVYLCLFFLIFCGLHCLCCSHVSKGKYHI